MRRLREVELKAATYKADRMATWKQRGEIPRLRKPAAGRRNDRWVLWREAASEVLGGDLSGDILALVLGQ